MDEPRPTVENAIEVRIEEISQLFHSLDPFPFRERDLDQEAEEFIVGWARELSFDQQIKIVVHLPEAQASTPEAREIGGSHHAIFRISRPDDHARPARALSRRLASPGIGVTVLSFSIIVGQTLAANLAPRPISRVIEESLLIFGWVANWRPIEIFLYEWWPIVRRRNLYRRLSAARVKLRPYKSDPLANSV
jgi:hypothetical protein